MASQPLPRGGVGSLFNGGDCLCLHVPCSASVGAPGAASRVEFCMVGSAEAWMGLLATHRPAGHRSATRAPCLPILGVQAAVTSALCHDAHMLVSRFHVKPMVKHPTAVFRETSADVSETAKA